MELTHIILKMSFKDDSVSAFFGQHTNQSDWACVVLCEDCCLWQAAQVVMYETIQASFCLKSYISFPFVKIKGQSSRDLKSAPLLNCGDIA